MRAGLYWRNMGDVPLSVGAIHIARKRISRAAENLAALAEPLDRVVEEGRLREIPGVGYAIADIIPKLHRTGTHPSLEKLREEVLEAFSKC